MVTSQKTDTKHGDRLKKKADYKEHPVSSLHGLTDSFALEDKDYVALAKFHLWCSPEDKKKFYGYANKEAMKSYKFWGTIALALIGVIVFSFQPQRGFTDYLVIACLVFVVLKNHFTDFWRRIPYSIFHHWWKDRVGEKHIQVDETTVTINQGELDAQLSNCKLYSGDDYYFLVTPNWDCVIPNPVVDEHIGG